MVRTNHRLLTIETGKTILAGQTVSYTVKRSFRARYIRLEVCRETGLTVVIPRSCKLRELPQVLWRKRHWILRSLARYGNVPSAGREMKSGDIIPYLDRELEVVEQRGVGKADTADLAENRLVVSLKSAGSKLGLVVEWWYRQQAEKLIRKRADELCARMGVAYARLSIRGARTRWGSCSQKGNLSFNWKLMMVPESVIDYVVIHELAHLKEMNHSARFWQLVARQCPAWLDCRRWLRNNQARLAARLPG
ncbi:MAG: M48 family metallopeptidase [Chloroflexi bacterium]|nr:M48 family metallopeptidase [Chloroflexota bacterium]